MRASTDYMRAFPGYMRSSVGPEACLSSICSPSGEYPYLPPASLPASRDVASGRGAYEAALFCTIR